MKVSFCYFLKIKMYIYHSLALSFLPVSLFMGICIKLLQFYEIANFVMRRQMCHWSLHVISTFFLSFYLLNLFEKLHSFVTYCAVTKSDLL